MYNVPTFVPKVYLIHRDGRKWEYKNIEEAARVLRAANFLGDYYHAPLIGSHFNEAKYHDYIPEDEPIPLNTYDYIVRDELGTIITCNELREIASKNRTSRWRKRYLSQAEVTQKHFRDIPIPYTGRRPGYNVYRKIHTTPEHRDNDFLNYDEDALEYNIKARPSRRKHMLPTSWDDNVRSDFGCKNWKRFRKHQWKEKS